MFDARFPAQVPMIASLHWYRKMFSVWNSTSLPGLSVPYMLSICNSREFINLPTCLRELPRNTRGRVRSSYIELQDLRVGFATELGANVRGYFPALERTKLS